MIKKILTYYAERLNEYLSPLHHQPEGLAEVSFIGNTTEEKPNKIVISLYSIEKEASGGVTSPVQHSDGRYIRMLPPLMLNLNVIIAAVYDVHRYTDSLSVLSDTLKFIQSSPQFKIEGEPYTIEIVTLTGQELNNVWTTLGGQYYPSVVCKIRRLVIDAEEIIYSGRVANAPIVNM